MQRYNKFLIYANFGGGFVEKNECEQEEKENASRKEREIKGRKKEREQEERKERTRAGRKREREQDETRDKRTKERTRAGRNMPRDVFRMQASKAISVHKIIE